MAVIQKGIAQIGFAKQSGKGSPQANATFSVGVFSGSKITGHIIDSADLDPTWASNVPEGFDRLGVRAEVDFECVGMSTILGFLTWWILGADAVTGGADPFSHTITDAADESYGTIFGKEGSENHIVSDCKLSDLEISFNRAAAVRLKAKAVGCAFNFGASAWTSVNPERPNAGYLTAVGGQFNVDGASPGFVESGSIKFARGIEAVPDATQILPADVVPQELTVTGSLKVRPPDTSLWRKVLTGTTSGSTVQATPYYGALNQLKFIQDTNHDWGLTIQRARFLTDFPQADPKGGAADILLQFAMAAAVSGANVSVISRNLASGY